MFRSRFADAFSSKLLDLGPQDLEHGVVDRLPSPQVESLLCSLLGLVLNRKKPVECVSLLLPLTAPSHVSTMTSGAHIRFCAI
jgi:hypothetical protein